MSDWDLMMPGMGLTAIGLAGVVVAYAGIAKTFIDGMHALTGLTMFFGLIFLSCGILSGGISTSNKAKATTLVIFGIAGSFGAFAFTMTSVSTLPIFAGVLLVVIIPTIVISYAAMKVPQYAKPISVIFILAAGVGIASFVTLGFVGPGAQFSLQPPVLEEEEKPKEPAAPTAPIVPVEILAGAATPDNSDYDPDVVTVTKGDIIEWTNNDDMVHTVTSTADTGATFDSSLISTGSKYRLNTENLAVSKYPYFCTVHPFMTATIVVQEPKESIIAKVIIPQGAMTQSEGQLYYDPQEITVSVGTIVVWSNDDTAAHTVTSGNLISGESGEFDSDIFATGKTFEHKFDSAGTTEYFCKLHPWMTGNVTVQ